MKKSESHEDIGYSRPVSTVDQILRDREAPPKGRQPNFTAEFKARFGCTPEEASEMRRLAEEKERKR